MNPELVEEAELKMDDTDGRRNEECQRDVEHLEHTPDLKGTSVSERFTVLTYICILYWLCLVTVHKDC